MGLWGSAWHPRVAIWWAKSALTCQFSLLYGPECRHHVILEKSFFSKYLIILAAKGHPSGARKAFRRVLSVLWSKRKASHEGFSLAARAARARLAPFLGPFGGWKSCHCVSFHFLGVQYGDLASPPKNDFFQIFINFTGQKGAAGEELLSGLQLLSKHAKMTGKRGFSSIFHASGPENMELHHENSQATSQ